MIETTICYRCTNGETYGIIGADDGREPLLQALEEVARRDADLSPGYAPRVIVEAWRTESTDSIMRRQGWLE